MNGPKRTLCLDFDGVLHDYQGEYTGDGVVGGKVVPGAVEFVQAALDAGFIVTVHSARCSSTAGWHAIAAWLDVNGFPAEVSVSRHKPLAWVSLDDRAVRFEGVFPEPAALLAMQPWNRCDI